MRNHCPKVVSWHEPVSKDQGALNKPNDKKSWEDTVSETSFRRKGIKKENNVLDNIVRILGSFIKTFNTVEQCRTLVCLHLES